MNAQEHLRTYANIMAALQTMNEQTAQLRAACDSLRTADGEKITFEEACTELADYTTICDNLRALLQERCKNIQHDVQQLPQPYRKIIWLRYIRGFSWRRIEEISGYSRMHVYRLHGHGLQILQNMLKTQG